MADAQTPTPAEVLAFLRGAGEIDGVGFGDRHPTLPGAFWWRRHLPMLAAQAPAQPAEAVAWEYRNQHGNPFLSHTDPHKWHPHDQEGFGQFRALVYAAPSQPDRAVMQQALDALEYHVEQTRPIERSTAAIAALRAALSATMEKP